MSIVRNLKKRYSDFSIEISEWKLPDQGIAALLGASGSGKTSVVRLLLGLEKPDSLEWTMGDTEISKLPVGKRRLGVVFQNYLLFPHLSAEDNILFGAESRGISKKEALLKIKGWESFLEFGKFKDRPARLLSGGEQQRVALARALIGKPRFLFLDEPFSALDASLRESSRQLVKALVSEEKIPTLLISHDPQDVQALAQQEFRIDKGRIVSN